MFKLIRQWTQRKSHTKAAPTPKVFSGYQTEKHKESQTSTGTGATTSRSESSREKAKTTTTSPALRMATSRLIDLKFEREGINSDLRHLNENVVEDQQRKVVLETDLVDINKKIQQQEALIQTLPGGVEYLQHIAPKVDAGADKYSKQLKTQEQERIAKQKQHAQVAEFDPIAFDKWQRAKWREEKREDERLRHEQRQEQRQDNSHGHHQYRGNRRNWQSHANAFFRYTKPNFATPEQLKTYSRLRRFYEKRIKPYKAAILEVKAAYKARGMSVRP